MKKIFKLLLVAVSAAIALFALAGCEHRLSSSSAAVTAETPTAELDKSKSFVIALYPEYAPISCENFEKLVNQGFYNGLSFHRVISGFMIQGGCPDGTGMGGPGWHIKGEFLTNGVNNPLKHSRGVLSMARAAHPDSAGSQFFIMHADAPYLDGNYAAFGEIVEGLDVVDEIAAVQTNAADKPLTPQIMKTVEIIPD